MLRATTALRRGAVYGVQHAMYDADRYLLHCEDGAQAVLHVLGPEEGVPVLLLPGSFSSASSFLGTQGVGLARTLATHGFRAATLDVRGRGAAEQLPTGDGSWDFARVAKYDVSAAVQRLHKLTGGKKMFLGGHSSGGALALTATALNADLLPALRGMIFLATPTPEPGPPLRRLLCYASVATCRLLGTFPARALRLSTEDEFGDVFGQWMSWNQGSGWRLREGEDGGEGEELFEKAISQLNVPLLALAGIGDTLWSPPAICAPLIERTRERCDGTFVRCGKETGYAVDFTHSSLLIGRAARREVWPVVLDWLRRQCAADAVSEARSS